MNKLVDTEYPAESNVDISIKLKVAIPPRLFRGGWQQQDFDVNYFANVVMKLIHTEAAQQYAKAVAKARSQV